MTRRKAPDTGEEGTRRRDVTKREIRRNRARIRVTRNVGVDEHPFDLAGEHERVPGGPVVERLLAEPIARQDQAFSAGIPHREREHALEPAGQLFRRAFLGQVGDHLRVASGCESVATALETAPELAEVVDLAVEDNADRPVLGRDRGIAVLEVDDGEPVLADRAATADERTVGIRASVALTRKLSSDDLARGGPRPHEPCDSTHAYPPTATRLTPNSHR